MPGCLLSCLHFSSPFAFGAHTVWCAQSHAPARSSTLFVQAPVKAPPRCPPQGVPLAVLRFEVLPQPRLHGGRSQHPKSAPPWRRCWHRCAFIHLRCVSLHAALQMLQQKGHMQQTVLERHVANAACLREIWQLALAGAGLQHRRRLIIATIGVAEQRWSTCAVYNMAV